jgi:hypothetical protein
MLFEHLTLLHFLTSCSFFRENRTNKGDFSISTPVRCVPPCAPAIPNFSILWTGWTGSLFRQLAGV